MTQRSASIPLPPEQARCEPLRPGKAASSCARKLATIPSTGGTMTDYTALPGGECTANCSGYLNVQTVRIAAQNRPAPARPVRPAVKGIG